MAKKNLSCLFMLFVIGVIGGIVLDEYLRAIYEITPPARPSMVPASATWEGGEDGGNWFACTPQSDTQYRCVVFSDTSGARISDGIYGFTPLDIAGKLNPVLRSSDTDIVLRGARLVRVH